MAFSGEQKSFCVLQLTKTESIITVQRGFRTKNHTEPPMDKTIKEWYRKFKEMCRKKNRQARVIARDCGPRMRILYQSPKKSTRHASQELEMSHVTAWGILRKRLPCKPYWLQLLQALTPEDHSLRHEFCLKFQECL
jgi:hypothetical protein